eukprot:gene12971-biopygen21529
MPTLTNHPQQPVFAARVAVVWCGVGAGPLARRWPWSQPEALPRAVTTLAESTVSCIEHRNEGWGSSPQSSG